MGGHHVPKVPEVPDWRIYRVEDVPELVRLQKLLAQHGLSDPWLRNEVWKFTEYRHKYPPMSLFKIIAFRGFKYGALAGLITYGIQVLFFSPEGKKDGHH